MRDEHLLAELLPVARSDHIGRNARQIAKAGAILTIEHEWNKPGTGILDFHAELTGQIVSKGSCSDLRDRESTSRYDQRRRTKLCA